MAASNFIAHDRFVFGWTDHRGMYSQPKPAPAPQRYDMSTDWVTNVMGTVIIMIPITAIAYWIWFG